MSWRDHAVCLGIDTNLFYPTEGNPTTFALPLSYCARCPVIEDCRVEVDQLEQASWQVHGIWGGETAADRKRRRRQEKRAA